VETFFPLCGKIANTFSIVWKNRPKSSTLWKTFFHSVEKSIGADSMKKTLAILLLAALAIALAGTLNVRLLHLRGDLHLTQAPPTQNMPPLVAFTTVALGGFRGILADILWMRAGTLQDEGRYFELVQLSDWIVKLQPRSPAIWAYHAWNMAYNLSALMAAPAERWRWVRNGIGLLRDEGMVYNPGSPRLHQELAWLFLHKLGTDSDTAAAYYRAQWAAEVDSGSVHLDPALVRQVEEKIAPLDWRTPQAQAIYWAMAGLPFARTDFDDLALRRMVYQALLQRIALGDRALLVPAIAFVQETQTRHPRIAAVQEVLQQLRARQAGWDRTH
jgi:hypothetical protein